MVLYILSIGTTAGNICGWCHRLGQNFLSNICRHWYVASFMCSLIVEEIIKNYVNRQTNYFWNEFQYFFNSVMCLMKVKLIVMNT
jgi:hypothetical protein